MFVSSALMGMALMIQRDPSERPREAFAACLRTFVESSLRDRKSVDAFNTEVAQQCMDQERAYRDAMIRRDVAARVAQATAERDAADEISYTRTQSSEYYADANRPG